MSDRKVIATEGTTLMGLREELWAKVEASKSPVERAIAEARYNRHVGEERRDPTGEDLAKLIFHWGQANHTGTMEEYVDVQHELIEALLIVAEPILMGTDVEVSGE